MKQDETKLCAGCKQELPLTAFSPDKRRPCGLQSSCRQCYVAIRARYAASVKGKATIRRYRARPEYKARHATTQRKYVASPQGKAAQAAAVRAWSKGPKGRRWRERHQSALDAQVAVRLAIQARKLVRRPSCESCGLARPLEAHHHLGYAPEHHLDVQWLCVSCHKALHTAARRTQAAG